MKKLLLLFIVGLSAFLPAAAQGYSEFIAPDVIGMTKTDSVEYVSPSGNEYRVFSMASTSLNQFMVWRSNKHGIIMKTADNLRKITVDWSSNNKTAAIALFGSDEPCPGFSELAQDVEWGTFVGELVRGGEKDEDGNEINVQTELIVPEDVDYKYYIVRLPKTTASGSALSMTNIKSFTFDYVPREAAICAPITVTLPDGEVLGNNNVTLAEPMELSVSCATEGASLSFDFDGLCGLLPANPGVLAINRCGRLVLRAEKEGFEPSERTMQITIPVKPIVMSIGGEAVDEPELRIYGPTDVALSTATPGASLTWTYTTASGTTTGSGESV
ncbi:MAG: hypothetical protein K2L74_02825, partial [Muribaculaceae bacterium]|nr:hypothetical protein [Muribaculaceae bacterium]